MRSAKTTSRIPITPWEPAVVVMTTQSRGVQRVPLSRSELARTARVIAEAEDAKTAVPPNCYTGLKPPEPAGSWAVTPAVVVPQNQAR